MIQLSFITSSNYKFESAKKALEGSGIKLLQETLETPEIQSFELEDVVIYSAKWAAEKLNKPIVLTDAGYYIKALNGFPGPFVKFINKWLTANDLIKLMDKKIDRTVEAKDCLAYCKPDNNPVIFTMIAKGTISQVPGNSDGSPIDKIFIPEGFDKQSSEIPREKMIEFWNRKLGIWKQLADYLQK